MGSFIPDFNSMHADPRLAPLVATFPGSLFTDQLWRSIAWAERYVDALVLDVLSRLDLTAGLDAWASADELCDGAMLPPDFAPRAGWLLDRMAVAELLEVDESESKGERRYRASAPLPTADIAALRAAGLVVDPGNLATAALLDAAWAVWPRLARGETSGEDALLGAGDIGLWLDYFANSNTLYAANNRLGAIAAADHLAHLTQLSILELGAGAGSGTEALLEEIAGRGWTDRITGYVVSEPSAFFRRRGERRLRGRAERPVLTFGNLDIDRPWAEQGMAEATFDLVFAVNVLHVADDLIFSLQEARRHLQPGGWLVAGECLRPFTGYPVYIEFVFRLLDSFLEVRTAPDVRPEPGFLTPEAWQRALSRAGFAEIEIIPDHGRIREIEPRFFLGALCAR
jgi:SAM-dependent methyltransferase